jgi:hypothetical protein
MEMDHIIVDGFYNDEIDSKTIPVFDLQDWSGAHLTFNIQPVEYSESLD